MPVIYEDSVPVMFKSPLPILFSTQVEKNMGLALEWQAWKPRFIEIREDATLIYRQGPRTAIKDKFNISVVKINQMTHSVSATGAGGQKEFGIIINCKNMQGIDTAIRCILNEEMMGQIEEAIKAVSNEHRIEKPERQLSVHMSDAPGRPSLLRKPGQSVMRSAIAQAMDKFDSRTRKERIIARRGAMHFLPVLFSSDLVHGAWWFVLGSGLFLATSCAVLHNTYDGVLGTDDSVLSEQRYRDTWILMIISGIFCTLGKIKYIFLICKPR